MKLPTFDPKNSVALDQVTYLSGAQEHRHEVPKPGAQPHQQPQGPQEPRPEAQCTQWCHLCWAYCQDDSGGKGEGKGGWVWTGLEGRVRVSRSLCPKSESFCGGSQEPSQPNHLRSNGPRSWGVSTADRY